MIASSNFHFKQARCSWDIGDGPKLQINLYSLNLIRSNFLNYAPAENFVCGGDRCQTKIEANRRIG